MPSGKTNTIDITLQGASYTFPLVPLASTRDARTEGQATGDWREAIDATIAVYLATFPNERQRLAMLTGEGNAGALALSSRQRFPGHITGSGVVIDGDKVLLIRHPVMDKWLQPGGHLDDGELPVMAAAREVQEESGWRVTPAIDAKGAPLLLDIDIHAIPDRPEKGEPAHWHYDFLYLFAPVTRDITAELPVTWLPLAEIDDPRLGLALSKLPRLHERV